MTISAPSQETILPIYDLDPAERAELFVDAIDHLGHLIVPGATNVLAVDGTHPLANYARSAEADTLPIVGQLIGEDEATSRFLLVLQDDDGTQHDAPAHIFRINQLMGRAPHSLSGLPTFDDAVKEGMVSEDDLVDYYDVGSMAELGQLYINVEANFAVKGVKASMKKPYGGDGYSAIFKLVRKNGLRGVVASQNMPAMKQLAHLGLRSHPLMGDPDLAFYYPTQQPGETGLEPYYPLTVEGTPWSKLVDGSAENNYRVFTDPEYATSVSRIAGLVASRNTTLIDIH